MSREFARTVDLELMRMFLEPFSEAIGFSWSEMPADETETRNALYVLFEKADERYPQKFHTALFNIMMLSTPSGADLLQDLAHEMGVRLVPDQDLFGPRDGRHLNPRYLALRAYLFHKLVFERALTVMAFRTFSAPLELLGAEPGAEAAFKDQRALDALKAAISAYFVSRYQGKHCETPIYEDEGGIRILVQHCIRPATKSVEREGREETVILREMTQDTLQYDSATAHILIGAKSESDKKALVGMFAEHILGNPEFFAHPDADRLYSLEPLRRPDFKFEWEWDHEVSGVRLREIRVDRGNDGSGKLVRYSPWSLTVTDTKNALHRLLNVTPELDLSELRVCHAKFEFDLSLDGRKEKLIVKVSRRQAAFRDHSHEQKVWEHLERNGFRRRLRSVPTSLAAE